MSQKAGLRLKPYLSAMNGRIIKPLNGTFKLAFGTGSTWRKEDPNKLDVNLIQMVKYAIESGYRHLDTAELYNTESEVGEAIKQASIPPSELYITAKVFNMTDIPASFSRTLDRLGVDYVDMYLLHHPYFAKTPEELQAAWSKLEAIYDSGKVGAIGVSNFTVDHLKTILEIARVKPALNQVELNPYLQRTELQNFHTTHEIRTMAFSPLSPIVRANPGPLDDLVSSLAEKYGVSSAAILICWALQQGITVVTTSTKKERMKDHFRALTTRLSSEEVALISRVGEGKHFRGRWNDIFAVDDRS